jgi:Lysozyme like domain
MAVLTPAQLEALWLGAGGAAIDAATAAAIALAESGGSTTPINNTAYKDRPNYRPPLPGNLPEYSVGLWQINIYAHPQWTEAGMLDPAQNAKAAVALRDSPPFFNNWSTYTDGAYAAYLSRTQPSPNFAPAVRKAPPKPTVRPWVTVPALTNVPVVDIPPGPVQAWRGLWHELGSNLPFYINHSRASRRALRAAGRLHG